MTRSGGRLSFTLGPAESGDANLQYRKLDESAAKQRQREQEAEERRARERAERESLRRAAPAPAEEAPATETPASRPWAPTKAGGWRDREAGKKPGDSAPPLNGARDRERDRGSANASPAPASERKRLPLAPRTLPKEDIPVPPQLAERTAERRAAPSPDTATPKPGVYRPGALSGRTIQPDRPASPASGGEADKPKTEKWVPRRRPDGKEGESSERGSGGSWGSRR